ncbi:MAG: Gldg family protein [Gammaproteobacteria bacterium]
MEVNQKTRWQLRTQTVVFVALLVAVIGLLAWLSTRYNYQADWTANHRNSLAPASVALLKRMPGPIEITAFASKKQVGGLRDSIRALIKRYQREKPDIHLSFADPDTEPQQVRAMGVRFQGELVISYKGRTQHVQRLNERTITDTLQALVRGAKRTVVFLSGHGERNPSGSASYDYGQWAKQLKDKGISTTTVNLAKEGKVPANTSTLVIAGPQVELLPGEVKLILAYVKRGGSLLWLHDPGPLHGLAPLAKDLGIEFQRGVVVDPTAQRLGERADAVPITGYGQQAIVKGFNLVTFFPQACPIKTRAANDWKSKPFLTTTPQSWSETGPLNGVVSFDKGKDIHGPLNIGVALTRKVASAATSEQADASHAKSQAKVDPPTRSKSGASGGRIQRVVVIGDGDFLSNAAFAQSGNLDLGQHIINWLSHDDRLIDIPARVSRDITVKLSSAARGTIALVLFVLLPLALFGAGLGIWLRRRKL